MLSPRSPAGTVEHDVIAYDAELWLPGSASSFSGSDAMPPASRYARVIHDDNRSTASDATMSVTAGPHPPAQHPHHPARPDSLSWPAMPRLRAKAPSPAAHTPPPTSAAKNSGDGVLQNLRLISLPAGVALVCTVPAQTSGALHELPVQMAMVIYCLVHSNGTGSPGAAQIIVRSSHAGPFLTSSTILDHSPMSS